MYRSADIFLFIDRQVFSLWSTSLSSAFARSFNGDVLASSGATSNFFRSLPKLLTSIPFYSILLNYKSPSLQCAPRYHAMYSVAEYARGGVQVPPKGGQNARTPPPKSTGRSSTRIFGLKFCLPRLNKSLGQSNPPHGHLGFVFQDP